MCKDVVRMILCPIYHADVTMKVMSVMEGNSQKKRNFQNICGIIKRPSKVSLTFLLLLPYLQR